jgi:hypothetical protein
MDARIALVFLGLTTLSLGACSGLSPASAATDAFVADQSCPDTRVSTFPASPSADVAADPERLAVWKANNHEVIVRGCGEERCYDCEKYGEPPYHYTCGPCVPAALKHLF